ncbi:MAG: heavy-metal-associated domain-containing protein [Candidatus Neomarinimicrobiota bacterium]
MKYTFNVPTMSCQHCKMRIKNALTQYSDPNKVDIDLATKIVSVESDTPQATLVQAIESAGYHVENS